MGMDGFREIDEVETELVRVRSWRSLFFTSLEKKLGAIVMYLGT